MAKRGRKKKFKVVVVDDHTLVRDSLVRIINESPDLQVVASTGKGEELMGLVETHKPDIVLLDIELPDRNGLFLGRKLLSKYKNVKLVFLTVHRHEEYARRGLSIGAKGFLMKTVTAEELLNALRRVLEGDYAISPEISQRLALYNAKHKGEHAYDELSTREFEVLKGLAEGKTCRELADEFDLSVKTIYTYRKRLLDKLNLKNDIELLRYVIRHNLLTGENRLMELDGDE